jgi:pSer/pThr/pTyr-binding forkhead associated (FHA) protein
MPPLLEIIKIHGSSANALKQWLWVGRTFPLTAERVAIGRHPKNDIPLYTGCKARHHAQLRRIQDDYYIEPLPQVVNYTLVNGVAVTGIRRLRDGDVISIDKIKFVYRTEDHAIANSESLEGGSTQKPKQ